MSLRTLIGLAIWPALFLMVFAVSLLVLPARPLLTVSPPEGVSVAGFSPDSRLLMTPSVAGTGWSPAGRLHFWEIPSGRQRVLPNGNYKRVKPHEEYWAEFLPDGTLFLRRDLEQQGRWSLKVEELGSRREVLSIESPAGCPGCLSADKRTLATLAPGSTDTHVEIWDIPNRRQVATLSAGAPVAIAPDGRTVLCRRDRSVNFGLVRDFSLWDVEQRNELGRVTLPVPTLLEFTHIQFSPDGRMFAISHPPSFFGLYDTATQGTIMEKMTGVTRFAFGADGKMVLFEYGGEEIARWYDISTGEPRETRAEHFGEQYDETPLFVSPDGNLLAIKNLVWFHDLAPPSWTWLPEIFRRQYRRAVLDVYDFRSGQKLGTVTDVHQSAEPRFSPDGSMLAVATEDRRMAVWPVPPQKPIWLAASFAAAFVAAAWALCLGYRRFTRGARCG